MCDLNSSQNHLLVEGMDFKQSWPLVRDMDLLNRTKMLSIFKVCAAFVSVLIIGCFDIKCLVVCWQHF